MATYMLIESGCHYDTVDAPNVEAALELAEQRFDGSAYDITDGTIWVEVHARNAEAAVAAGS